MTTFAYAASSTGQAPPLDQMLDRATTYVTKLEDELSRIIGEETYEQQVRQLGGTAGPGDTFAANTVSRTTRSEMMFLWLREDSTWFAVRNVETVRDGGRQWRSIADSQKRLDRIMRAPVANLSVLRQVADESARYNIGSVYRNYNSPTLALLVLDLAYRHRFLRSE